MLKKLLILATIVLLTACTTSSKEENMEKDDNFKVEDQTTPKDDYQTLDSAAQAEALDKANQAAEVEVQDRIFFGDNSAELTEESKKILAVQTEWLKSDDSIKITIEGHCDERGTREYNIALGEKRANSAKKYLLKNGISKARIKTVSYGKERPAYFGAGEDVMSKNRRAVTVAN